MEPRALFIVRTTIPAEKEESFNRWYNEDHFKKVIARPGLIRGVRYKIIENGGTNLRSKLEGEERFRFMAVYEYENNGIIDSLRKSGGTAAAVADFTAHWPESERLWTRAIQIYPPIE